MSLFTSVRDHIDFYWIMKDMCFHGLFCLCFSASTPAMSILLSILFHINLQVKVNICLNFQKNSLTQSFNKQCTFPKELWDKFVLNKANMGTKDIPIFNSSISLWLIKDANLLFTILFTKMEFISIPLILGWPDDHSTNRMPWKLTSVSFFDNWQFLLPFS